MHALEPARIADHGATKPIQRVEKILRCTDPCRSHGKPERWSEGPGDARVSGDEKHPAAPLEDGGDHRLQRPVAFEERREPASIGAFDLIGHAPTLTGSPRAASLLCLPI